MAKEVRAEVTLAYSGQSTWLIIENAAGQRASLNINAIARCDDWFARILRAWASEHYEKAVAPSKDEIEG